MLFKTLIAAIDVDDDLAEGVIRTADSLAQKDGASLTVVCVWPPLAAAAPGFASEVSVGSTVVSEALMEQHREGRKDCAAALDALVKKFAPKANAVVLDGDPADAVTHYAKKQNADLIVTGS
ncbi:MAG: universal stress protein, partial [Parvularculaceae bacterium]